MHHRILNGVPSVILHLPFLDLLLFDYCVKIFLFFIFILWKGAYILVVLVSDKPPLEDLLYFLEFQVPRQWAPMFCELPLRHQRKKAVCPSLQFSFMGSKVKVSSTQVLINTLFFVCLSVSCLVAQYALTHLYRLLVWCVSCGKICVCVCASVFYIYNLSSVFFLYWSYE